MSTTVHYSNLTVFLCRHLRYERVYLPLHKVADTPFHIQGEDVSGNKLMKVKHVLKLENLAIVGSSILQNQVILGLCHS